MSAPEQVGEQEIFYFILSLSSTMFYLLFHNFLSLFLNTKYCIVNLSMYIC